MSDNNNNDTLSVTLMEQMNDFIRDYNKFAQKGNNAAGIRARKGAQEMKKTLHLMREHILELRKSR